LNIRKVAITCEENMGNANECQKLLEPPISRRRLMKEGEHM